MCDRKLSNLIYYFLVVLFLFILFLFYFLLASMVNAKILKKRPLQQDCDKLFVLLIFLCVQK